MKNRRLKYLFIFFLLTGFIFTTQKLSADEDEIRMHYLGHSSFIIHFNDSIHVLTDFGTPYCWGLESPIFDLGGFIPLIMTISHYHDDHYNADRIPEGITYTLEYLDSLELNDLFIKPVRTCENNINVESNTSFVFDYKGFKICHLGDAQAEIMNIEDPAQQQIILQKFPEKIDMLFMTIEGVYQFIPQAELFIDLLKPRMVIPMHYWTPEYKEDFLSYLELQNDTAGKNYEIFRNDTAKHDLAIGDTCFDNIKVFSLTPFSYGDIQTPARNLAINCPASASSFFDINHKENRINDGYFEPAWRSGSNDLEWSVIDLKELKTIDTIIIYAVNPATEYDINISGDSVNWETAFSTQNGGNTIDTVLLDGPECRYIQYDCKKRKYNTGGYWINEFVVYTADTTTSNKEINVDIDRLQLFPNPCQDIIHLDISSNIRGNVEIVIYNQVGRLIKKTKKHFKHREEEGIVINVDDLLPGIYFLVIQSEKCRNVMKIMKN